METVARGGGHRSPESHDGIIVEPLRKMGGTTAMPDDLAPRGFYEGLTARSLMAGGRHLVRWGGALRIEIASDALAVPLWHGYVPHGVDETDEPIVAEFGLLHHVDG
jgi:hypothetical protein